MRFRLNPAPLRQRSDLRGQPHGPYPSLEGAERLTVGPRPAGITALSLFFVFGAVMSGVTAVMLATPGGPLDPVWRIRPAAREELVPLGVWAILLMATVSLACLAAAVGLWTERRAGYRLAAVLLVTNLLGDLANAIVRGDPRTLIGVPIVAVLLWYLRGRQPRQPHGTD